MKYIHLAIQRGEAPQFSDIIHEHDLKSFLTGLKIIGMDDVGVVNKITNLISGDLRINIAAITIEAREGLFEGTIKLFVHDKEELEELVKRLMNLQGIHTVDRFDAEAA